MKSLDSQPPSASRCPERRDALEVLRRYFDQLSEQGYYGQVIVSWEKGMPITVKQHVTLKLTDVEKLLDK